MKKLLQILLLVLFSANVIWAQPHVRNMEQIHAAKMVYLSDRLHLSIEQSQSFIPFYNEYEKELRGIRQDFKKKLNINNGERNDEASDRQYVDDNLDYQQQVLDLKRRYNDRFLKVISSTQLATLYQAEREFKHILLQRLKERKNGPPPHPGGGRMFDHNRRN